MDEIYDDLDELPTPPRKDIPKADRQLLELAARALGAIRFEEMDGEGYANLYFEDGSTELSWNPLVFSGDALELVTMLAISIERPPAHPNIVRTSAAKVSPVTEGLGDYPKTQTRRAIVRAAAEIGKAIS